MYYISVCWTTVSCSYMTVYCCFVYLNCITVLHSNFSVVQLFDCHCLNTIIRVAIVTCWLSIHSFISFHLFFEQALVPLFCLQIMIYCDLCLKYFSVTHVHHFWLSWKKTTVLITVILDVIKCSWAIYNLSLIHI